MSEVGIFPIKAGEPERPKQEAFCIGADCGFSGAPCQGFSQEASPLVFNADLFLYFALERLE